MDVTNLDEAIRRMTGYQKECHDVEQNLGIALKYPRYVDDQKNFPGSTEADGVCVGEHTPASLAMEAAQRIIELENKNDELMSMIIDPVVVQNLEINLRQALARQITLTCTCYPPVATQGGSAMSHNMSLVTAVDVNHWIEQIHELMKKTQHLEIQLARATMQRDAQYARADAMEQTFLGTMAFSNRENRILKENCNSMEHILRRVLQTIINSRLEGISRIDMNNAEDLLRLLEERRIPSRNESLTNTEERGMTNLGF